MEIHGFIIPESLQNNQFLMSLQNQLNKKMSLSIKQIEALEDILEIQLDFFLWDAICPNEMVESQQKNFDDLMYKIKKNRFRVNRSRNRCIRAVQSIVDGAPRHNVIDEALGRIPYGKRYWRR